MDHDLRTQCRPWPSVSTVSIRVHSDSHRIPPSTKTNPEPAPPGARASNCRASITLQIARPTVAPNPHIESTRQYGHHQHNHRAPSIAREQHKSQIGSPDWVAELESNALYTRCEFRLTNCADPASRRIYSRKKGVWVIWSNVDSSNWYFGGKFI